MDRKIHCPHQHPTASTTMLPKSQQAFRTRGARLFESSLMDELSPISGRIAP